MKKLQVYIYELTENIQRELSKFICWNRNSLQKVEIKKDMHGLTGYVTNAFLKNICFCLTGSVKIFGFETDKKVARNVFNNPSCSLNELIVDTVGGVERFKK